MKFHFAVILTAALLLAGCAADLSRLGRDGELPRRAEITGLKAHIQEPDQCAAAALATLLEWASPIGEPPENLVKSLYNPGRKGAFRFDVAREARRMGLLAWAGPGDLPGVLREIAANRPVIVLENRGLSFWEVMHWSVAAGFDLENRSILLFEGGPEPVRTSLDTFSRTFKRGGSIALMVLKPGELPVTATPDEALAATAELEKAAGTAAALPYWTAFGDAWPGHWIGRFAGANALYHKGDLSGAAKELETAAKLAPERPEPVNNLAMIEAKQGRLEEAQRLAASAVKLAAALGLDTAPFEETLREVGGR